MAYTRIKTVDHETARLVREQEQQRWQEQRLQRLRAQHEQELEQREQRRQRLQEVYRKQEEERKQAHDRSKALFMRHLTKQQQKCLKQTEFIICIGSKTKAKYTITPTSGMPRNVHRYYKNARCYGYCSQAPNWIPCYDTALIKKLLIENDEPMFLATNQKTYMGTYEMVGWYKKWLKED